MAHDPTVYPASDTRINKLNIRDTAALEIAEAELVSNRAEEPLPSGDFDYAHLRAIHCHLFQDVYDWAGEQRMVNISKGNDLFALALYIEPAITKELNNLQQKHFLRGLPFDQFITQLTHTYNELNAIHPFREGNGRTLRAFFSELAVAAGYALDWTKVNRAEWITASVQGFKGNVEPLQKIFAAVS